MGARKYNPLILSYCRANGIEVPPPFDRHPASRFAVVRLDCTPPKLSAKTFGKKADLHYYIRSNMKELRLTDGAALPLRIIDFADHVYLTIDPDGRTRPGLSFANPGHVQSDAS